MKFHHGDRVIRIAGDWAGAKMGNVYTVLGSGEYGCIELMEDHNTRYCGYQYTADKFELYKGVQLPEDLFTL